MAQRSKQIHFYDAKKLENVNPETLKMYEKYNVDMELRELSQKTISSYYSDLTQWWIYIYDHQDNKSVLELDEDDITEFLFYCKKNGNNTRRMRRRMSSIAAFYNFLRRKKYVQISPCQDLERPKKDLDVISQPFLTIDQVHEMRVILNTWVDEAKTAKAKDRAMTMRLFAMFALSTLARINAIRNATWDRIDYDENELVNTVEKEGYIVDLGFSDEVASLLKELFNYRKENGIQDGGYIFYSSKNGEFSPMDASSLNEWSKKIGVAIGVPGLHNHSFRKSGATLLKNQGMLLEDVSKLLNHKSTDVTNKFYIKENKEKLKEAKKKFEVF